MGLFGLNEWTVEWVGLAEARESGCEVDLITRLG
jgi:hypothetical protein